MMQHHKTKYQDEYYIWYQMYIFIFYCICLIIYHIS